MNKIEISETIKTKMKVLKLSKSGISKLSGLNENTVGRIVRGEQNYTIDQLMAVLECLKLKIKVNNQYK